MRAVLTAVLAAAAASLSILAVGGCEAADDVQSGIDEARSSAASIGAGARQACRASGSELTRMDDLAGQLAEDPSQRIQLAPEVRETTDRLAAAIGDRAELQPVLAAARDLSEAVGEADQATVETSARQAQVAVRSAQALCKLAG